MIPQTASRPPLTKSSNGETNSNGCGSEKNASANSGYSADGSVSATLPPIYIGFKEANKRGGSVSANSDTGHQSRSNRRKTAELSYTASKAMEYLKKGGLAVPTIQMDESRELEGHKVDMSKVKLTMAKTVALSPFLINQEKTPFKMNATTVSDYESLFSATYQSYEKHDTTHSDSSTSSVTSSESDDISSMPPPAVVLPPRLEDALKMKAGEAIRVGPKRKRAISTEEHANKVAKLVHITMNEALEASNEASRLTGFSSAKVLGKPLQQCLGGSCKEWMKIGAPHPVAALHERTRKVRSKGDKHQQCKCHAILVGPQLEGKKEVDTTSVTHYAVSFLPVPVTCKSAGSGSSGSERHAISVSPKQVMG